ncbi:MAG: tRNA lysidine(34) synthetase TilS [Chromatiales bacterium]
MLERLQRILSELPRTARYHLAFSGGLDSSVLLHLLVQMGDRLDARLQAVHVQHGLQEAADSWAEHCARVCRGYRIPLRQLRLGLRPRAGESLEALARERRYAALAGVMAPGELLLTAQHRDDQAETLLLQLLRGSGPAGLAAMPALCRFGPGWLARPLLDVTRAELQDYAEREGLCWIEDPSNSDLRFDRNYLRHEIMPLLLQRWPAATSTLARSARLSAELHLLADELAAEDLKRACGPWPGTLSVKALLAFPSPRRRSLLRHWVSSRGGMMPGSRHLQRIEQECLQARQDAQPLVQWKDLEVRRYRDGLFLLQSSPVRDFTGVIHWRDRHPLRLPSGLGFLRLERAKRGISAAIWDRGRVEVRFRQGGEHCIPAGRVHHRPLKKLFQEWSVPPWQRDRIPLVYLDGQLAAIPGYLWCEPFGAAPGEPALRIHWETADSGMNL